MWIGQGSRSGRLKMVLRRSLILSGIARMVPAMTTAGFELGERARLPLFTVLLLIGFGLAGCGHGPGAPDSSAFKSAPADLQAAWKTAFDAAKTNGYVTAYSTLETLGRQTNLDAGQRQAVEDLQTIVGDRLLKAANDGDPQAVKSFQEIKKMSSRRPD
jgi:hypothetical protein